MAEYIDRELAMKELELDAPEQVGYSREDAIECIRYIPAADVAPVRHGKWIIQDNIFTRFKWSACGYENHKGNEKYCSNCGTKMNLEVNNVLEGK